VTEEKILMSLILDKDMVVTDAPCTGATLIAQYGTGYFAVAVTAGGTCVFGLDGGEPLSIDVSDLLNLLRVKHDEKLN